MSHKKAPAGLVFDTHQVKVTSAGLEFDKEFKNKVYEKEEQFRSKIILQINEFAT